MDLSPCIYRWGELYPEIPPPPQSPRDPTITGPMAPFKRQGLTVRFCPIPFFEDTKSLNTYWGGGGLKRLHFVIL